jgi:hypothetical protein
MLFLVSVCPTANASTWSHAFDISEGRLPFDAKEWKIAVERLNSEMDSYYVTFLWERLWPGGPVLGVGGTFVSAFAMSPQVVRITDRHNAFVADVSVPLNARNRKATVTAVSVRKRDLYGLCGVIEFSEGYSVPYTVVWDDDGIRSRLFLGQNLCVEDERTGQGVLMPLKERIVPSSAFSSGMSQDEGKGQDEEK